MAEPLPFRVRQSVKLDRATGEVLSAGMEIAADADASFSQRAAELKAAAEAEMAGSPVLETAASLICDGCGFRG